MGYVGRGITRSTIKDSAFTASILQFEPACRAVVDRYRTMNLMCLP